MQLKQHTLIMTDKGRVTIQTNAFGIPEIKVRVDGNTYIISCEHERIRDIEIVVDALLASKEVSE